MPKIAVKPFVLRDCIMNLKDGATDLGDYESSLSKVEIVPSVSVQKWTGLTPSSVHQDVAAPEWTCNIDHAQDWETANSFSQYCLANVGRKVTAKFTPKTGGKAATVVITILPGAIGGGVGSFATASVAFPCDGQPVVA